MSPEQVAAEYPYVNSVMPVCNPYAIRYGENMLPSIYEAENSVTTGSKKLPLHMSPLSLRVQQDIARMPGTSRLQLVKLTLYP